MKKETEELIKGKSNNIYEKYYSDNPDFASNEKKTEKANIVWKLYSR